MQNLPGYESVLSVQAQVVKVWSRLLPRVEEHLAVGQPGLWCHQPPMVEEGVVDQEAEAVPAASTSSGS